MISWIIYVIVSLILLFILYLAILGINRGVLAKNMNKKHKSVKEPKLKKNTTNDLKN